MKKVSMTQFKVWSIVLPLLLYWVMEVIVLFLLLSVFGTSKERYMLCEILTSAITLPMVYFWFYRLDHIGEKLQKNAKQVACHIVFIVLIALGVSVFWNNIICMSPLIVISQGFAEANAKFYGSTMVLEIIGSGILTPILEETLYRGVIYERLRKMMGFAPAMVLSSLLFAVMHFNVVQFVFAFGMGLLLAWCVEKTGHVYGSIVAHMTSNVLAVIRTETGFLNQTVDGSASAWVMTVVAGAIGLCIWYYYNKKKI